MIDHAEPGPGFGQHLADLARRGVDLLGDDPGKLDRPPRLVGIDLDRGERLVDQQVDAARLLDQRVALLGVAREHHRPTAVVDAQTESVVRRGMHDLEGGDADSVLFPEHALAVIDGLDFGALKGFEHAPAGLDVPRIDLAQMSDDVFRPGRPPDPQRPTPPVGPAADPELVEPADVIDVVMGEEDLVDFVERDFERGEIGRRARTRVEQHLVSAGLDEHAGRRLSAARKRGPGAEQGHPDRAGLQGFAGVEDVPVFHRFPRCRSKPGHHRRAAGRGEKTALRDGLQPAGRLIVCSRNRAAGSCGRAGIVKDKPQGAGIR